MTISQVISGGQFGADLGGLLAAKVYNIPTSGWVPRGYKTERGPNPQLLDFGLKETPSEDYKERTRWNIRDSDGTVIVAGDFSSPGTKLTISCCKSLGKPFHQIYFTTPPLENLIVYGDRSLTWIQENTIRILNIAGNRESVSPGIQNWTTKLFLYIFHILKREESHTKG